MAALRSAYPWVKYPFVVSAPMLGASTPALAASVSRAGAFGFLAGGTNDANLDQMLRETRRLLNRTDERQERDPLPIGVGFQLFNSPLNPLAEVIAKHKPAAVWLFAPRVEEELASWSENIRRLTNHKTKIWIQVGTVEEALRSVSLASPDVLVCQGNDAGGHGLRRSASIVSLIPEMLDNLRNSARSDIPVLAAGGIVDSRGVAAAIALGASGAVLGTRFLSASESGIANGWKTELLRAKDGGITTVRSTLPDRLKETKGWPVQYDGRVVKNKGHTDEEKGMDDSENIRLYREELKLGDDAWGSHGRMVAYAGTGVGMVQQIEPAEDIVSEILRGTKHVVSRLSQEAGENPAL